MEDFYITGPSVHDRENGLIVPPGGTVLVKRVLHGRERAIPLGSDE